MHHDRGASDARVFSLPAPSRDANAVARIRRMERANFGDTRSVGERALEMRIDHGPGYRIYYARRGGQTAVLLCGATSVRGGRISSGLRCWLRVCDAQDNTI